MFRNFNKITLPDERDQIRRERFMGKLAVGLFSVGLGVTAIFSALNRANEEDEKPYKAINNAFCTDPSVRPPYLSWANVPFRIDWDNLATQSVQTFTYDFNVTTHSNDPDNTIEGFVASIPQEFLDNPDMFLVMTGHASRDTPEIELVSGQVRTHRDNTEVRAQRAINNRKVAQGRLDHFAAVLNWPEDRLRLQNLETDNNKREVNIQLCDLAGLE